MPTSLVAHGSPTADWGHELGRRDVIPRRAGTGVYAFVQPDGGWMVNNCGVVTDGSGDALLVDTSTRSATAPCSPSGRGGRTRSADRGEHHHPDHTYGNGFLPASTTIVGHHLCREGVLRAGLKATEELPADYGDLVVRPPDLTVGSDVTCTSVVPRRAPGHGAAHSTHDIGVWLPSRRSSSPATWPSRAATNLPGGSMAASARPADARPRAERRARSRSRLSGDEVGRVLDDLEEASTGSRRSPASPTPPVSRPWRRLKHAGGPYRLAGGRTGGLQPAPGLHRGRPGDLLGPPAHPALWPEMVALNGGPIACHA